MPPKQEKPVCPLCHKVGHTTNRRRHCDFFDPNKAKKSSTKKNEAISSNKDQSNEGGEATATAAPEIIGAATKTTEKAEPKIIWKKSRAKQLLYDAIKEQGRVPLEAKDSNNKSTIALKDIYNLHPTEFSKYHYSKFSSRISSLRKTIKECNGRAVLDQERHSITSLQGIQCHNSPTTRDISNGKDQTRRRNSINSWRKGSSPLDLIKKWCTVPTKSSLPTLPSPCFAKRCIKSSELRSILRERRTEHGNPRRKRVTSKGGKMRTKDPK
jgi:hypothetical protein